MGNVDMNNFFVEEEKENTQEVKQQDKEKTKVVPNEYVPVKLSTLGKMGASDIVHVRDYSGKETYKFSLMNDQNMVSTIIEVVNALVYEDIDAGDFHERDLEEILLTIHSNFWGTTLPQSYRCNEEELEYLKENDKEKYKEAKKNNDFIKFELPVNSVETNPIPEDFQEPISIKIKDMKLQLLLPRVKNILTADTYLMKKYAIQEQQFSTIKKKLEYNRRLESTKDFDNMIYVDENEVKEFQEYQTNRGLDSIMIQQAQLIKKFNDEKVDTLDQKIEAYYKIPQKVWDIFGNTVKNLDFGVKRELQVLSPITSKKVTRRFQFRLLDFIPTMELQDDAGYTVSFGE